MDGRLNFADVEQLVSGLPIELLELLATGPLPDADDASSPWNCNVCRSLRGPGETPPMRALLDWHEFEADVPGVDSLLGQDGLFSDTTAAKQWQRVAGMLSHARCCVIYALAMREVELRSNG